MTTVSTIVTADSKKDGGIGHVRLEWPVTIRWNERSRSFGIGGHVGVEYAEIGQAACRTIDRQHAQSPPALLYDLLISRIQQNIVQCDQCLGLELLPGAAEGRFGYRGNGCWIIRDGFEKLVQFIPVGAFAEVQQQWDQPL